ncbi:hypothetical protein FGIG_01429 [Fasciola gigantica]|uniref:G-protein coupled receptors family 1 profile domain-containing protein n=1 Tax=Fasciola gigantica TaxID=46835 RepID=A0A504YZM0_FASGI|nr:hypothetical protein FGIG_01429 [Fasciola gigantica]
MPLYTPTNMCELYEKEEMSAIATIVSSSLLAILCFLGVIGNILVIVVYCVRPTRSSSNRPFIVITQPNGQNIPEVVSESNLMNNQAPSLPIMCDSPSSFKSISRRRRSNSMQTRLILLLAVVDLGTCVLILPWDILRSVRFAVSTPHENGTLLGNPESFLEYNSYSGKLFKEFFAFIWFNHAMTEILRLLRNVAFACEGSILAGIAVERYMTVVGIGRPLWVDCLRKSKCAPCSRRCTKRKQEMTTVEFKKTSQLPTTDQYWTEENGTRSDWFQVDTDQMSTAHTSVNFHWSSQSVNKQRCLSGDQCGCNVLCSGGLSRCFKRCSKQPVIWGTILGVCLSVLAVELLITVFHLRIGACQLSNSIREYADKSYVTLTLVSFVLVCYLYLCIFITVRQIDIRKRYWSNKSQAITHEMRVSKPMSSTNDQGAADTQNPAELESEITRSTESRTPFEMVRAYKYVSFAAIPPGLIDSLEDTVTNTELFRVPNSFRSLTAISATVVAPPSPPLTTTKTTGMPPKGITLKTKRAKHPFLRSRRTGMMLFTSTVVFYATLFPLLWVHLKWWSEDIDPGSHENQGHSGMAVHHEFYYVNNAINVFIYSLFNNRFRERLQMVCSKRVQ